MAAQVFDRTNAVTPTVSVEERLRRAKAASTPVVEQLPHAPTKSLFRTIAEASIARGETRILPILIGAKSPARSWKGTAIDVLSTKDWAQALPLWIDELEAKYADLNGCVIAKPDEQLFIDNDTAEEFRAGYEAWSGEAYPVTFTTSATANHYQEHFLQTDATRAMGNIPQFAVDGISISVRQRNLYVLIEGSKHPSGRTYTAVVQADIVPMPDKMVAYIQYLRHKAVEETIKTQQAESPEPSLETSEPERRLDVSLAKIYGVGIDGPVIPAHAPGRDNVLFSIASSLRQAGEAAGSEGWELPEIQERLILIADGRCEQDGEDCIRMAKKCAKSACDSFKKGIPSNQTVIMSQTEATRAAQEAIPSQPLVTDRTLAASAIDPEQERANKAAQDYLDAYENGIPSHTYYAMTAEEFELEKQKEFPVFPLKISSGPKWSNDILYGDAGRLVLKASEYNESHPAGMLVDFLVSLGSIIGRSPHFAVGDTMHYTNEFFIRVGDTARSRKGTGRDAMDAILKYVDPVWFSSRIENGFGSGEAIIGRIRDSFEQVIRQRDNTFKSLVVPGIDDKRLCIREGEAASILVLASKPDSRADIILRDGWDGKVLRNLVKGNSRDGINSSAKCENPHLSISADTTISELRAKMPSGAEANGFGNRFLYVYASRVKDCPQGSPQLDWSAEMLNFQEVVKFAKTMGRMPKSQTARDWWSDNYTRIEHDVLPGLAGLMTARASAHIARLAMIYALIDFSEVIERDHFLAAKRLWDYCADSALLIFGGMTKEQAHISSWIELHRGATYKQIRDNLYHRNRPVTEIKADLDALVTRGVIRLTGEIYAKF